MAKKNTPQVIMSSEEFGTNVFDYETIKDAKKGYNRLKREIKALNDGVERTLTLSLLNENVK